MTALLLLALVTGGASGAPASVLALTGAAARLVPARRAAAVALRGQ